MTTEPTPTDLDFLDFKPSCIDGTAACRNTASHWTVSKCCGETVLVTCGQCKTAIQIDCKPWRCMRCGHQWDKHATAFVWGELYGKHRR